MMIRKLLYITFCLAVVGCSTPSVPENFTESKSLPKIYPDYTDVTVPINIAPLTFEAGTKADGIVARLTAGQEEVVCGGTKVQPDASDWRKLVESASGKAINVEVYIQHDEEWTRYKSFDIHVSPDSITPYIRR